MSKDGKEFRKWKKGKYNIIIRKVRQKNSLSVSQSQPFVKIPDVRFEISLNLKAQATESDKSYILTMRFISTERNGCWGFRFL